jgi:hypothetical protein
MQNNYTSFMDRPVKCKTMNDKKSTNSSPILPDLNVLNIKSSKLGRVATLHGKGGGQSFSCTWRRRCGVWCSWEWIHRFFLQLTQSEKVDIQHNMQQNHYLCCGLIFVGQKECNEFFNTEFYIIFNNYFLSYYLINWLNNTID